MAAEFTHVKAISYLLCGYTNTQGYINENYPKQLNVPKHHCPELDEWVLNKAKQLCLQACEIFKILHRM